MANSVLRWFLTDSEGSKPIKIDIAKCSDVADIIEKVKEKLPEELVNIALNKISLWADKKELRGDTPLPTVVALENSYDHPFTVKWQKDLPVVVEVKSQFGTATMQETSEATGIADTWEYWDIEAERDKTVALPNRFVERLEGWLAGFSFSSEADRRRAIDFFLNEVVVDPFFKGMLRASCEVQLQVAQLIEGGRKCRKLAGSLDYVVYHCPPNQPKKIVSTKEAHLVAVEAKKSSFDESLNQCIAEAAAIHKARKDAGKSNRRVWGVLSNGEGWCFIRIDNEGSVYCSPTFQIQLEPASNSKDQVLLVYQLLHYVVKCSFLASPTTSPIEPSETHQF